MQGQRAGVVSRFLADAIDLLVVIAAVVAIHLTVSGLIFLLHPREFTWPEVTLLRHGTRLDPAGRPPHDGVEQHGADVRQAGAGAPCGDVP